MWPKALLELLPHLTRLVPIANRYFQSKAAGEDATRLALERKLDDVATAVRKDIAEISASTSTADLTRQLTQHNKSLAELATAARSIQSQIEGVESRLTMLEKRSGSIASTVAITHILTLAVCIVLVIALVYVYLHK